METLSLKNKYESIKDLVFNYPDGDNMLSWLAILKGWIKKNRTSLYTKSNKVIATTYVMQVVKSFNKILLDDLLFNHVIFSFPGNKLFMFIAQAPEKSVNKKLYFDTGMYNLKLFVYYASTTRNRAVWKYIYFVGLYKNTMMRALRMGHKYPRHEDVVNYLNKTLNG